MKKGFTLIELLVVVAIIALLVAILIPALDKAREVSQQAVCAGNLHQTVLAVTFYAGDNDGKLPSYAADGSDWPKPASWLPDMMLIYVGGDERSNYPDPVPGMRKLSKYIPHDSMVWRCPSDVGIRSAFGIAVHPVYEDYGSSYFYNGCWYTTTAQFHWPLRNKRITDLRAPSRQIVFGDWDMVYTWPRLIGAWPLGPHGTECLWHDKPLRNDYTDAIDGLCFFDPLCTLGFLDGHAETLRLGPYGPGDYSANTSKYILDPDYNP